MKKYVVLVTGIVFLFALNAAASMMGGGYGSDMMGGNGTGMTVDNGSGMMLGDGTGMTGDYGSGMMNGDNGTGMMGSGSGMMSSSMMSNGNFGMTNGTGGAPMVADDGTAYLMSTARTGDISSMSFQSVISAVDAQGNVKSLTLQGIVSRPVIGGDLLVATASLPEFGNYSMMGNNGINGSAPTDGQSVLYVVDLPLTENSKPEAISLDGNFASVPVIANGRIYITTSDYGNAMMGNIGNLENGLTGSTYLYIFNFEGTLISKTEL